MNNLGHMCSKDGNNAEEREWYIQSANLNNAEASFLLGKSALNNNDEKEAYKWFMKSTNLGSNSAGHLGSILRNNTAEKITWCLPSANKGDSLSINNVGFIHWKDGNEEKAIEWLTRSANLKNPVAMYNLWEIYDNKDKIEESYIWLVRAANLGYQPSIDIVPAREVLSDNIYNILININIPGIKANLLKNRLKKDINISELINIFLTYANIQLKNKYLSNLQMNYVQKYVIIHEFEQYIPCIIKPLRILIIEYLV